MLSTLGAPLLFPLPCVAPHSAAPAALEIDGDKVGQSLTSKGSFLGEVAFEGLAWTSVAVVDVEWSNLIAVFLARNCGRGRIPILGRCCEDARLVFCVQLSQANRELVLGKFTQAKDATRVCAGFADAAFPWVPCRQVDGSSATAELLD